MITENTNIINRSVEEVLIDRIGKVKSPEIYSSKTQFMIIYPNGYSIIVTARGRTKFSDVQIYQGIIESTKNFLPNNLSKKVNRKTIEDIIASIAVIKV